MSEKQKEKLAKIWSNDDGNATFPTDDKQRGNSRNTQELGPHRKLYEVDASKTVVPKY